MESKVPICCSCTILIQFFYIYIYINKLSAIYPFFTLLIVKLFLKAMAVQNFLHRFIVVSSHLLV